MTTFWNCSIHGTIVETFLWNRCLTVQDVCTVCHVAHLISFHLSPAITIFMPVCCITQGTVFSQGYNFLNSVKSAIVDVWVYGMLYALHLNEKQLIRELIRLEKKVKRLSNKKREELSVIKLVHWTLIQKALFFSLFFFQSLAN